MYDTYTLPPGGRTSLSLSPTTLKGSRAGTNTSLLPCELAMDVSFACYIGTCVSILKYSYRQQYQVKAQHSLGIVDMLLSDDSSRCCCCFRVVDDWRPLCAVSLREASGAAPKSVEWLCSDGVRAGCLALTFSSTINSLKKRTGTTSSKTHTEITGKLGALCFTIGRSRPLVSMASSQTHHGTPSRKPKTRP